MYYFYLSFPHCCAQLLFFPNDRDVSNNRFRLLGRSFSQCRVAQETPEISRAVCRPANLPRTSVQPDRAGRPRVTESIIAGPSCHSLSVDSLKISLSLSRCAWSLACDAKRNWVCGRFVIRWYASGSSECNFVEYLESLSRSAVRDRCGSVHAAGSAVPAAPAAAAVLTVAAAAAAASAAAASAPGAGGRRPRVAHGPVHEGGTPAGRLVAGNRRPLALLGEDRGAAHAREQRKKSWQVRATIALL